MQMTQNDGKLVKAALCGESGAYEKLMRRYESGCRYYFFSRCGGNMETAKDLAQEAFMKAFRGLATLNPQSAFRAWFWTICRNVMNDYYRKHAREKQITIIVAPRNADEPGQIVEKRQMLQCALSGLSEDHREIIELKYLWELTLNEVAEVTGKPLGTVKTHLTQARKRLCEIMNKEEDKA